MSVFDSNGNETKVNKNVEKISSPVVINELAWAGTKASPTDEWIELYNKTDIRINLNGFKIVGSDGTPSIELSGEIGPSGYFLLEKERDEAVLDLDADFIYGDGGAGFALSNNGDELLLKVNEYVIDRTPPINNTDGCGFKKWCAGDDDIKTTMERVDPDVNGALKQNWGAPPHRGYITNGVDANNQDILGTPGKENAVVHLINIVTGISAEKTLTKKHSPYLITDLGFTVSENGVLIIDPGVVIKFVSANEPNLFVKGKMFANGTLEEPIVFTSFYDDEYGGDFNNDGLCNPEDELSTSACPGPGSWGRIKSYQTAEVQLDNTIVRYGGRWFRNLADTLRNMIHIEGGKASFSGLTVEGASRHGIFLDGVATTTISNSIFRNINNDFLAAALIIKNTHVILDTPIFENNNLDIRVSGSASIDCINCSPVITTSPPGFLDLSDGSQENLP